jgi:hypothetical protein
MRLIRPDKHTGFWDLWPSLIPLLLLVGMYYTSYVWLISVDWPREDYNYCYLIPLIVLYLIWEKRKELSGIESRPSWTGLFLLLPGILCFWVGNLGGEFYSIYLSSWLVGLGLLWIHIGWNQKDRCVARCAYREPSRETPSRSLSLHLLTKPFYEPLKRLLIPFPSVTSR